MAATLPHGDGDFRTWGVSNIFPDSSRFQNEIVTYNLDGSKVYRLAHDQNPRPDYEAETHPMQSPDGLRVVFASGWGGTRPVSVYVIDLRPNCTSSTPSPAFHRLLRLHRLPHLVLRVLQSNPGFEDV